VYYSVASTALFVKSASKMPQSGKENVDNKGGNPGHLSEMGRKWGLAGKKNGT
jgi:hypothetical protein